MRCSVLLGTLVLLFGVQYGEAKNKYAEPGWLDEFKIAVAEVQQQNEARIVRLCQKITEGSADDVDLSEDDVVPQLSECCSLRRVDRTECFTSVLQNLGGHYQGELGTIFKVLENPHIAALKQLFWKKGSRQAVVGAVKSPNPLYAALFMPPRGDDTEGVNLVCRILEQSVDDDGCGSAMDWDQREDVCSLPEARSHYLVKQRKASLSTCCQATGQEKVDCFESLRPTMADQICDIDPLKTCTKLGNPTPCCQVTGQDRVRCIDKVRYGFSGQAGFSMDDYAEVNALMSYNDLHLSVPRNQSQAQQFCSWLGNQEFIPYTESEELALLRLDPEQMWGSLFRKEARCCLHTGTKLETCLNKVRETRNDELCSTRKKTNYGVKMLYWLEWLKSLVTGPSPSLEVLEASKDYPENPCCGMTGPDRHSCLAQLWRPFNATIDASDFSSAMFDHIQYYYQELTPRMEQTLGKYGAWSSSYGLIIYPNKEA